VLESNSSAVESFLDQVYRLLKRIPVFPSAAGVKRELSLRCENGMDFVYLQSEFKFSCRNVCDVREIYCTVGRLKIQFTSTVHQTQKSLFRLAVRATFTRSRSAILVHTRTTSFLLQEITSNEICWRLTLWRRNFLLNFSTPCF
jgi:hypothetical protein